MFTIKMFTIAPASLNVQKCTYSLNSELSFVYICHRLCLAVSVAKGAKETSFSFFGLNIVCHKQTETFYKQLREKKSL